MFQHIVQCGHATGQQRAAESVIQRLGNWSFGQESWTGQHAISSHAGLLLAGPESQTKHRMAQAIARDAFRRADLLYFDGGEWQSDHSVARLVGAPDNHLLQGELPTAIVEDPDRVLLIDEIDKSSAQIIDIIVHLIENGEVVSGFGRVFRLQRSVTVLTSNLGLFDDVYGEDGIIISRRSRFTYDTPFEELQFAVRDEFVNQLGRLELLGCLGGAQNIIVFDFLRDLHGVTRKFVTNVIARCASNHNMRLSVNDDVIEHVATSARNDPEALLLGDRGLAQHLERILVLPLLDFVFDVEPNGLAVKALMGSNGVRFTIR